MKELDIYVSKRNVVNPRVREACRGIVVQDGMILLSYEVHTDQWFLPGGGLEAGESREACCIRELREETGYAVKPMEQILTIREYCGEWWYITHYFTCEIAGRSCQQLTEGEAEVGLEPRWLPLEVAVSVFSGYADHADIPMKLGAYRREAAALSVYQGRNEDVF